MILAAALCVGTVAASAAGYFRMKDDLARHLGAGEAEAPLVSQAGLDLGQSCTVDGWTLTASQAMGDKTQVRVLLEDSGFRLAGIYEALTEQYPGEESQRIYFVAKIGMIHDA